MVIMKNWNSQHSISWNIKFGVCSNINPRIVIRYYFWWIHQATPPTNILFLLLFYQSGMNRTVPAAPLILLPLSTKT